MKRSSAKKTPRSSRSSIRARRTPVAALVAAALCLNNEGCDDLDLRKLYRLFPDKRAAAKGCLRVVDESDEDYLYPGDHFAIVRLPSPAARLLGLST